MLSQYPNQQKSPFEMASLSMRSRSPKRETSIGHRPVVGMRARSLSPRRHQGMRKMNGGKASSYLSAADIKEFAKTQQRRQMPQMGQMHSPFSRFHQQGVQQQQQQQQQQHQASFKTFQGQTNQHQMPSSQQQMNPRQPMRQQQMQQMQQMQEQQMQRRRQMQHEQQMQRQKMQEHREKMRQMQAQQEQMQKMQQMQQMQKMQARQEQMKKMQQMQARQEEAQHQRSFAQQQPPQNMRTQGRVMNDRRHASRHHTRVPVQQQQQQQQTNIHTLNSMTKQVPQTARVNSKTVIASLENTEKVVVATSAVNAVQMVGSSKIECMADALNIQVVDDVFGGVEWLSDDTVFVEQPLEGDIIILEESKYYQLSEDIVSRIVITASNVVLDLNGQTLTSQTGGESAITVSAGCVNVLIANGTVDCEIGSSRKNEKESDSQTETDDDDDDENEERVEGTDHGILVEAQTKSITVRDLNVKNFTENGILVNGTRGMLCEKLHFESKQGINAILVRKGHNVISRQLFVNVQNEQEAVAGLNLCNCTNVIVGLRARMHSLVGTSATGVLIDETSNVLVDGLRIVSARATEAKAFGIHVANGSHDVQFGKIRVDYIGTTATPTTDSTMLEKEIKTEKEDSESEDSEKEKETQKEAYGIYVDEDSTIVPSNLADIHVREVSSDTTTTSHHIVIDGRVVDPNAQTIGNEK